VVTEAVVFDLDGVLIDSEPVWEQVRRAYVADQGGRWPAGAQDRLMGMSTAEWARYLAEDAGVDREPADIAAEVVEQMTRRYARELPLLPGALEVLGLLAGCWRLGLASSSPRALIDAVLATAGLAGRFAVTVSTEEVPRGKPAPDVYLAATRALGFAPERCVAVEDSTNGLLAAASAGLAVVAVPRPRYPPSADALRAAAVILTGLHELTPVAVDRLGAGRAEGSPGKPAPWADAS